MGKTKGFLKVEHELLDNFALRPLEKLIYMLLLRLRDAPRGCCPSYEYLMKRSKVKRRRTLLSALDRLSLFGYITWKHRGNHLTNEYIFRVDPHFEQTYLNNLKLRSTMSRKQKEKYHQRLLQQGVESRKVKLIK